MNPRLLLSMSAVLLAVHLAASGDPLEAAEPLEQTAAALDPLLQVLTGNLTGFDEYSAVSHQLEARGAEAVPWLVKRLPASSELAKLRILGTLSRIGPASAPALEDVRRLLKSDSPAVRAASADCLRGLGVAGRDALPDLVQALNDRDEITVGTAARAIGALDPDFVGVRLAELLDRLGTSPAAVDQLRLDTWHCIACRSAADAALALDLRHWMLVVHFTDREDLRVVDALK